MYINLSLNVNEMEEYLFNMYDSDITTLTNDWMIVYPPSIFHRRYPLGNLTDENVYSLLKDIKNLK